MISVHKPAAAPEILKTRGREETDRDQQAYEQTPADYASGAAKLSFHADIYGHSSVKEALIAAQHGKCCFCEAKITHIGYGDVEHFRPKAGYRQHPRDPLGLPGYYWLAYDWGNLYLSCQLCNQRFKKNLFPLIDAGRRCRNHLADLNQEEPLFIDPGGAVNPEDHIEFLAEQPRAKKGSRQGRLTIRALALRREPLRERRFDRYRMLSALKNVVRLLPDEPEGQEALAILEDAIRNDAEYAAMARCLIARKP
ncbi:MAG TPA: hypothetical protein VEW48_28470 [Thermoanaerobaculia bacterium]|nr:hypothetical protein [Thermoanaerobaculia bacterium]